ncbi:arylsulfatase B [Agrilus planipennis]|uniref:Arylsulfatase B n=1 Tax=Agrilus planipennis TaxID=224129 RepID=A0A1W4XG62_AGRPL|nr:arylsulfatase B [Agrilus planipennis]
MLKQQMMMCVSFWLLVFVHVCCYVSTEAKPNIILIVADDLGWNDVGFHGSNQIPTPNIDALAYNGIILNEHYVQSSGTATRSSLFTGKYPIKLGDVESSGARESGFPLGRLSFWCDGGGQAVVGGSTVFGTGLTGTSVTGMSCGIGIRQWYSRPINGKYFNGFDLRKDLEPAWDFAGTYATDAITDYAVEVISNQAEDKPLFMVISHFAPHAGNEGKLLDAPPEAVGKFPHIIDAHRRIFAGMVSKLDDSVGRVVEALDQKGVVQNSVIIFLSDNGSPGTSRPFPNWGSNYPLRGLKGTLFEGGLRSVAFIWSPLLGQSSKVSIELIHVSDWLPTLVSAGGGETSLLDTDIDGIDLWSSLVYDFPSPRNEILLNIDEVTRCAALRFYNWKLIVGNPEVNETSNSYDGESGDENIKPVEYNVSAIQHSPVGKAIIKLSYNPASEVEYEILRQQATIKCLPEKAKKSTCDLSNGDICLFDIPKDPCEENNLVNFFPSVVRRMKRALVDYKSSLVPQPTRSFDIENADPKLFQFTWNPWLECANPSCSPT